MATFLLAWNPKRWQWADLADMSDRVKVGESVTDSWSCGISGRLQSDDRFFLIRLGEEPKGIFASGTIMRGSYRGPHWDDKQAAMGRTCCFVDIQYDVLLNPEKDSILLRELLNTPPLSNMRWDTQMSGVRIPDDIADHLEAAWMGITGSEDFLLPEEIAQNAAQEVYEGAVRRISVDAYERSPEARRQCIAHHGTNCSVCGFDFGRTYGEVGAHFIHVHHLRQLSEIHERYQVDPVRDMRPVCPNCHAIIHRRQPPYTIEEVKTLLQKAAEA